MTDPAYEDAMSAFDEEAYYAKKESGIECDRLHCYDTIGPCDNCPLNNQDASLEGPSDA